MWLNQGSPIILCESETRFENCLKGIRGRRDGKKERQRIIFYYHSLREEKLKNIP